MARIDFLKEKADKYKIFLKFLLNILFAVSVGISGLVYGVAIQTLTLKVFWLLTLLLLIIFIKGVIITLIVLQKSSEIDDEILKELP